MGNINIIDHHVGQIRNALKHQPSSREVSLALTKLDEFEMWLARLGPDGLVGVDIPEVVNEKSTELDPIVERWFDPSGDLDSPANVIVDNIIVVDSLNEFLHWAMQDTTIVIKLEINPTEWRIKTRTDHAFTEYRTGDSKRFTLPSWDAFCDQMGQIISTRTFRRISDCWIRVLP
jgi:hypothetical protein